MRGGIVRIGRGKEGAVVIVGRESEILCGCVEIGGGK